MSSLHRRIGSRLRFRDYIDQHRTGSQPAATAPSEQPPAKHRSLTRLYRELYHLLIGYRLTIALALVGSSVGTLLKLVPPFASKIVIDYIIPGIPLPARIVASLPWHLPVS